MDAFGMDVHDIAGFRVAMRPIGEKRSQEIGPVMREQTADSEQQAGTSSEFGSIRVWTAP